MSQSRLNSVAIAALVTGAALAIFGATSPPPSASDAPTAILFLGDSITGGPGCWRALVWVDLTDAGYGVDMVGTRHDDECGGVTNAAGEAWDPDNAGFAGETTAGMFVHIARDGLITETDPDVVVLLAGTNDVWKNQDAAHVLDQYQVLVGQMRKDSPTVAVVVGTMLPMAADACSACQVQIDQVNAGLAAWAAGASTPESPVSVAVINEGFDPAADTTDGVHPNEAGNAKMAAGFAPAIASAIDERAVTTVNWPLVVGGAALGAGMLTVLAAWRAQRGTQRFGSPQA